MLQGQGFGVENMKVVISCNFSLLHTIYIIISNKNNKI